MKRNLNFKGAVTGFAPVLDKVAKKTLFVLAGFLAARASVFGGLNPFAVALTAASPSGYIMYTLAGALVGHAFTGGLELLSSTASLIAAAGIRWALSDLNKITRHWLFIPLNAFTSVFAVSLIVATSASGLLAIDVINAFSEGIIAMGAAVFFAKACQFISKKTTFGSMTSYELLCLSFSLAVLLLPVISVTLFSISVGRIAMMLAVLTVSQVMHESGGSVCAAAFGAVIALSDPQYAFIAGAFVFSGVVSGIVMRKYKTWVGAASFSACSAVIIAASGSAEAIPMMMETVIACSVFAAVPSKVTEHIGSGKASSVIPASDTFRKAVLGRLSRASDALADISGVIEEVSDKLDKMSARDVSEVFNISAEEICAPCGLRACCWQTCLDETKSAFGEMAKTLTDNGQIHLEDLPECLTKKCAHPNELMQCVNRNYSDFSAMEGADRRVAEMRAVVNDQYSGMSELLKDIVNDVSEFCREDKDSAERIKESFKQEGYTLSDVNCRIDSHERMGIDIQGLCFGLDTESDKMDELLSKACMRNFEPPLIERSGDEFRLHTSERTNFSVSLGAAQHSCNNGRLCGDTYEFYRDGKGRVTVILSDGMGTGGHAAIDSCMASSLMARLLKGGFGCDCALKIVNCALMVKSNEESLATLDVACFDMYSGNVELFKAGAPLTLMRKGGRVVKVDSASLPAGILREITFERSRAVLDDGDLILMISDGALVESIGWIEQRLLEFSDEEPQEFCDRLVNEVGMRRLGGHDDDVTVILAKLERETESRIIEQSA